jgi:pSer/pThr/pTyr-binding forkhead associated (FHA) protein
MDVKLVLHQGRSKRREITLNGTDIVLGRRSDCGVRIAARAISRQHCRIRIRGEQVTVRDLGSANGTYVNGQLITDEYALMPGDRLQLGPVVFTVEYNASALRTAIMPILPQSGEELMAEVIDEDEISRLDEHPTRRAEPEADLPFAEVEDD